MNPCDCIYRDDPNLGPTGPVHEGRCSTLTTHKENTMTIETVAASVREKAEAVAALIEGGPGDGSEQAWKREIVRACATLEAEAKGIKAQARFVDPSSMGDDETIVMQTWDVSGTLPRRVG